MVRPLAEQLIDAATAQAQALGDLRDSWAPYDLTPWDVYSSGTGQADVLRRQVRSSVDELDLRYGIVPAGG